LGVEGAEFRVWGWSGRRDQVGLWGQRRVGGDEEVESRQEAGCADVEQSEARARPERKRERERRRDRSDLYRTCSVERRATPKRSDIT